MRVVSRSVFAKYGCAPGWRTRDAAVLPVLRQITCSGSCNISARASGVTTTEGDQNGVIGAATNQEGA